MTSVVVGVDFSVASRKALGAAVALAGPLKATVVVVHANEPLPLGAKPGALDPVTRLKVETEAAEVATLGRTWVAEAGRTAQVELVTRTGRAAEVVVREARERGAAYVIVGTHGRTGLKRAVLGSVAEAVVRASPVPVLVVPA